MPRLSQAFFLPADSDLSADQLAELARSNRYDLALGSAIAHVYLTGDFFYQEYQAQEQEALIDLA